VAVRRLYLYATLVLLGLFSALQSLAAQAAAENKSVEVALYVSQGCRHCGKAQHFLNTLSGERRDFHTMVADVQQDPQALAQLVRLAKEAGVKPGVPAIHIGDQLIVGFDSAATTGVRIRNALDKVPSSLSGTADSTCSVDVKLTCDVPEEEAIELPFTKHKLSVHSVGLPLFTIAIGLLDGFNPCSMWVLILMLSMLASLKNRRKMLAIAGTFVIIEGLAYFAFMAAWLNLFLLIGISNVSILVIGGLAVIAGAINLKDFFVFGRGITLSIPAGFRPAIYEKMRVILFADALWPALLGATVLAVLVQIIELMCTSGFPALYTRILTMRQLDQATYYGYLLLYNMMYMLDDILVLGIGVITLSQHRLQEKEGRLLKLISGLTMLGLGIYLLAR
jgi:hypothetical protein